MICLAPVQTLILIMSLPSIAAADEIFNTNDSGGTKIKHVSIDANFRKCKLDVDGIPGDRSVKRRFPSCRPREEGKCLIRMRPTRTGHEYGT